MPLYKGSKICYQLSAIHISILVSKGNTRRYPAGEGRSGDSYPEVRLNSMDDVSCTGIEIA